jgi:hypothetical protein
MMPDQDAQKAEERSGYSTHKNLHVLPPSNGSRSGMKIVQQFSNIRSPPMLPFRRETEKLKIATPLGQCKHKLPLSAPIPLCASHSRGVSK